MKAIWTTKAGDKIPVTEMSDSHLVNTIALLRRWAKGPGVIRAMLQCDHAILVLNGEMAIQSMEDELFRLGQEDGWRLVLPEIYDDMENEATARGLEVTR